MRSLLVFFLLAVLCSSLFASTVTIRVLDNWNTALYSTPVELLQKSVVVANAAADRTGYATMEVQDGEYIARVSRAGYPVFVSVLNVQGKTDVTLTAIQGRSYSVLYGTVYADGDIPEGMKVSAMRNGVVQSSAKVYSDGAYVLQFLEDGEYALIASASEYSNSKFPFSVSGSETKLMDVNLKKNGAETNGTATAPVETALAFVSIVEKGALYEPIKVRAGAGDTGAANVQVDVLTPDGKISLLTDESGIAVLNAAKGGKYVFSYMGVQSVVEISDGKKVDTAAADAYAKQLAQEEVALAAAAAAQKLAAQEQANENAAILFGVGALALLAVIVLAGVYFFMKGKKHAHQGMHGMHTHSHAHEGHVHEEMHGHAEAGGTVHGAESPLAGKKHAKHARK